MQVPGAQVGVALKDVFLRKLGGRQKVSTEAGTLGERNQLSLWAR